MGQPYQRGRTSIMLASLCSLLGVVSSARKTSTEAVRAYT
jgi:hypothetical protein